MCDTSIIRGELPQANYLLYTTGMPFFADCQKQSAKALKQVAKALPTALHVAKNSSAKKPLPPAKWKAVGKAFATARMAVDKGDVRRCVR